MWMAGLDAELKINETKSAPTILSFLMMPCICATIINSGVFLNDDKCQFVNKWGYFRNDFNIDK